MNDVLQFIVTAIPGVWRRRWIALWVAWIVCIIGWIAVSFVQDKFESSTRVFVDTQGLLQPLLRGLTIDSDPLRELNIMQGTLISGPNLEKVIRLTDLDAGISDPVSRERLITDLKKRIDIRAQRNNLFQIGFEDPDPLMAQKVVQALLTIFMETNLGASRREMDTAQRFLDDQLKEFEDQLNDTSRRISDFKKANADFLRGTGSFYEQMKQQRNTKLEMDEDLADLIARRDAIKGQLVSVPEFFKPDAGDPLNPANSRLDARIADAETRLDQLMLVYTEQHPDVVATLRQLEDLEARRLNVSGPAIASRAATLIPNPVYQNVKTELVEVEAQVATAGRRIERQVRKIQELESKADKTAEVEIELRRLNRTLGVANNSYGELLQRKEKANISENRETKADKVQFRIVEPPKVPQVPSGLQRSLLATGVLVLGIGAGAGVAILLVLLQNTIFSPNTLREITGLEVYGGVTLNSTRRGKLSTTYRHLPFMAFSMLLLATYGSVLIFERNVGLNKIISTDVKEQIIKVLPPAVLELIR